MSSADSVLIVVKGSMYESYLYICFGTQEW